MSRMPRLGSELRIKIPAQDLAGRRRGSARACFALRLPPWIVAGRQHVQRQSSARHAAHACARIDPIRHRTHSRTTLLPLSGQACPARPPPPPTCTGIMCLTPFQPATARGTLHTPGSSTSRSQRTTCRACTGCAAAALWRVAAAVRDCRDGRLCAASAGGYLPSAWVATSELRLRASADRPPAGSMHD